MVTIKQLAELCGVSRGTVDRVLNNRGKVNPEKAELIRRTAERLNYQPNPAGKALIARRKNLTVAIVMPSVGIAFFDDVIAALRQAEQKYALFGLKVIWRLSRGYDVAVQPRSTSSQTKCRRSSSIRSTTRTSSKKSTAASAAASSS